MRIASSRRCRSWRRERAAKTDPAAPTPPPAPLAIELDGVTDRKARLTIHSSSLGDALVSKDGESLYYLARFERGLNLWTTTVRTRETKQLVALNAQWLTGGPFGVQFIPKPWQGALGTGASWNLAYLALVAGVLLLLYLGLERLVRSPWGRVLRAIREDEEAAASLGKSAFRFRLQSFVIGSMLMGLGGALYAHFVGYIAPEDFLPILTFQLWAMLIVGGSGNNRGAILGAYLVWGFWALSGGLLRNIVPQAEQARAAALQVVLIGVLIALMLLWRPRGLLGEATAVSRHAERD